MNKSDIEAMRGQLGHGRDYWRSLEELADTDEFRTFLNAEFPSEAPANEDPVARRDFLRLMGASMALAGLGACTKQPAETIVPYVQAPEHIVPGKPLFFATAVPVGGYGAGVLVESHEGRPTKIEGNPRHPDSLGATSAQVQAEVLSLYDPDRSQTVTHTGWPSTWGKLLEALGPELEVQKLRRGVGVRILTGNITSPTLAGQIDRLRTQLPEAKWHQWEAAGADNARAGTRLAFGRSLTPRYDLAAADVILSLDADFLGTGPAGPRLARETLARRRAPDADTDLNRLYTIESTPTITGAISDHRLSLRPSQIVHVAGDFAAALAGETSVETFMSGWRPAGGKAAEWISHAVADLASHPGRSLVVPGERQPAVVHALAHAMNAALGNVGRTVTYLEPVEAEPVDHIASLGELVDDMNANKVDLLVVIDTNPVYSAPADLEFQAALGHVRTRVHLGLHEDETSAHCHWHVPQAHSLESWGDLRASDGTVSIVQPLIAPLYGGKTAHELVAVLLGEPGTSAYQTVRDHWREMWTSDFERTWQHALHDGVIAGSASTAVEVPPVTTATPAAVAPPTASFASLEVTFRPDPTIDDGRHANNGWLQELSKPLSKLTWDNAALLSPATARELDVANEDVVEVRVGDRSVEAPVWILPGQAEGTVTLHLGYGRTRAGRVGTDAGFDAYRVRTSNAPDAIAGARITKTDRRYRLASTQHHHSMEGRALVRSTTAPQLKRDRRVIAKQGHTPGKGLSLYPERPASKVSWGMVIDLNACIGCNACVVACQSENNIPVVGKDQVGRGREMAWLRIDRYYQGDPEDPETVHQPVPCMHCESAPCEPVCPVGATVHSDEGLNDMVYNRCVGTRYCSNNCPYKVRRFNFFGYADTDTESLKGQRNPDVTVRSRGVMEKCTYCVQRINDARITAKREGRELAEGDVTTACQQVCPTQAISFGNINDPSSAVAALRGSPLHYALLEELGTEPHTTYLGLVKNPNPELSR